MLSRLPSFYLLQPQSSHHWPHHSFARPMSLFQFTCCLSTLNADFNLSLSSFYALNITLPPFVFHIPLGPLFPASLPHTHNFHPPVFLHLHPILQLSGLSHNLLLLYQDHDCNLFIPPTIQFFLAIPICFSANINTSFKSSYTFSTSSV